MLARLLPAVCDVSVINLGNAACGFRGFARDKTRKPPRRHIGPDAFAQTLRIPHWRGIILMRMGVAATDVAEARSAAEFATAVASLFRPGVVLSLWALIAQAGSARRGRTSTGSRKPTGGAAEAIWATKDPREPRDRCTGGIR
jgi:hypothetical protein